MTSQNASTLVILNANVITLDPRRPRAEAVGIQGDRISAVGTSAELQAAAGPDTRLIDAQGKTVLPGFIDSHCHMLFGGLVAEAVDLTDARSVDDILERLRDRIVRISPGEWIHGFGFSVHTLKEKRHPTRYELDRVANKHPVWITTDSAHSSSTNTLAFDAIGLPRGTDGIERSSAGEPTGAFITDHANIPARQRVFSFLSNEHAEQTFRTIARLAVSKGITTIHALEGSKIEGDRDMDVMLSVKDSLPVRTVMFYETFDIPRAKDLGVHGIGGCGRMCLDGMPNTFSAALLGPYADNRTERGALNHTDDKIATFVAQAYESGLQVSLHAMGDAAIEQILDAYEVAQARHPGARMRHRIEHFHIPTKEQIERAAALGLGLGMQPIFSYLWGGRDGVFFERYGEERYRRIDRYRDILKAGAMVACGSDLPVYPADPFLWLRLLVDNPVDSMQNVSMEEALRMCSPYGAWAAFEEQEKGTIEVGKYADLVVIDRDPFSTGPDDLRGIAVDTTFVGGAIVYSKGQPA
jgi:predicted amidohydrolase YtcJ